jgi:leucyl aminopeptidase
MDFHCQILLSQNLAALKADALLLVLSSAQIPDSLGTLSATLQEAVAQGDFQYKAGSSLYLHHPVGFKVPRVMVVFAKDSSAASFKAAAMQGLALLKDKGVVHLAVALDDVQALSDAHAEVLVAAVSQATYIYRHTKPSAPAASRLNSVTLICDKEHVTPVQLGLTRGLAIEAGVLLAREQANLPANHCTPTHLANVAKKMAKTHGLQVQVLDRAAVEKLGMGSFLAVAQGAHEPLRFIVLQYHGAAKTQAPIVLVGKGITFDTGGISIKPAAEMDEMKYDMAGAASVLGALRAVAQLAPCLNVVGIIAACENMPDGRAVKPGDVVTSMSGQTIEILNTDAEGRLILCDALTYAKRFKPAMVIDVATLTGACVVALGHHRAGLFSNNETLAAALIDAGERSLDLCWRMPLDDAYDEGLKSNFADVANVGPRVGGAITAAMFLKRFAAEYCWAHLDVAGVAWKSGVAKGATGRPVPLLTHFLLSQASLLPSKLSKTLSPKVSKPKTGK